MPDIRDPKMAFSKIEAPPVAEENLVEADLKAIEAEPAEENFLEEEEVDEAHTLPAAEQAPTTGASSAAAVTAVQKDEVLVEVERVLEEGLGDFYKTLPPEAKIKFKQKGEEASTEITKMVHALKLNFKRALELVRDWLLTVPKVNKFFLEQEAKIKVDKINLLIEARKADLINKP